MATCLLFDDSTADYAGTGNDTAALENSSFTIEAWIKPVAFTAGNKVIYYYGDLDAPRTGYGIGIEGNTSNKFYVDVNADSTDGAIFNQTATANVWQHVAVTYNATNNTARLYVNGAYIEENTSDIAADPLFTGTNYGIIGAAYGGVLGLVVNFDGRMCDLRIWSDVRTDGEISANYNKRLTGLEAGLVIYYKMDENTGLNLNDLSPSNLDGTLAGDTFTPAWDADTPTFVTGANSLFFAQL